MHLIINGSPRDVSAATAADLLPALGLDSRGVVIEVNGAIVAREHLAATALRDGDRVELVRFVRGG
jgi:sulfur carrier protein